MSPPVLQLALPDGHLMNHVLPFLAKTGLGFSGYQKTGLKRRPALVPMSDQARELFPNPEKVAVKVIRPQDMPSHVAGGNFDMALSGVDWLLDHKLRFPFSPVEERLQLGFGRVRIVAAVHNDNADDMETIIAGHRKALGSRPFRIASEYVYIANDFAQKNGLDPCRIIMTYGATESLIPEDCDMIVENTETGSTLAKNNLKIIHTLMTSVGCLMAGTVGRKDPEKRQLMDGFETLFARAL